MKAQFYRYRFDILQRQKNNEGVDTEERKRKSLKVTDINKVS